MNQIIPFIIGIVFLWIGVILDYYLRKILTKRKIGSIELELQKRISKAKDESERILKEAKEKAERLSSKLQKDYDRRKRELFKAEQLLLKREHILDKKISILEKKEREVHRQAQELREMKNALEELRKKAEDRLEKISGLSKAKAREELLAEIEQDSQKEILERIKKLEREGIESFEKRAKEILAQAIQKYALSQAQEITTTVVPLHSDEIKGRIIGKEGRNIRTFEKLTGVELIVDETPEIVIISGFNPIRREIARVALEKLIQDGRIQPARIEEKVEEAKNEVLAKIKEVGEKAVYETGIVDLDPKLIELLGRLYFRTSYGQNVLLHSIEVAFLAQNLADELGADSKVARKAGLLHDIGKAIDRQIQGSHVEIGIKILEKFNVEKEVIDAMKSHHDEYPAETLEAVIVKVADQISGARPGARKDTLENYLQRLGELEEIALSFPGVEKAYAIQAGREIRVFVKPEEVDDLAARKIAKEIANKIEGELVYPGEIKVTLIRESKVVEIAK